MGLGRLGVLSNGASAQAHATPVSNKPTESREDADPPGGALKGRNANLSALSEAESSRWCSEDAGRT